MAIKVHSPLSKNLITAALVGSLLGAAAGFLNIAGLRPVFSALAGAVIATLIAGAIGFATDSGRSKKQDHIEQNVTLRLREEQLELSKEWVKTGNVDIQKNTVTEEKTITVPVTREELVITKSEENTAEKSEHPETIRIPISEERIEVTKEPVVLNEVSIDKRHFLSKTDVEETIKKEVVHVERAGSAEMIENVSDKDV